MLSDHDLQALQQARHPDPFSVLGMHADGTGRLWVRAFLPELPEAAGVTVHDTRTGQAVATLAPRGGGLFEAPVPRRRRPFDYRLHVHLPRDADRHGPGAGSQASRESRQHHEGRAGWRLADAYRYGPLLAEEDLRELAAGTHLRPWRVLGAHPLTLGEGAYAVEGVRFAVWAPNARRVSVVGDFNGWDGRRHPMRNRGASGVWELFVPHAAAGERYKYELLGADGTLLPLKADPFARRSELRPGTASVVDEALPPPRALAPGRAAANAHTAPMAVYELHAGSWRRHADGRFWSWDELAQALPGYVAGLGFTHVELLPVSEHPFDGSWGYQTLGLYAPSARFGEPEGLVRFTQACHERGLGVIVDWVPAHFPADEHGLARFDGTALYEYADPKEGWHPDWHTFVYNYARLEVRNFLAGSALYWLERFGVDGLRVDAVASMLYRDYSRAPGQWVPNAHGGRENLEAISLLQRINEIVGAQCPGAITLAEESTAFPRVSAPTWAGGLGFHYKWNMGWMNDTLRYMREDPVHRRWHHERLTFGLVYAFSENFVLPLSHDEVVHGKGSLLARMPGDDWQRFANLRAYYGFMWGHPGRKLLFMGQEFAQGTEWDHDRELPWALADDARHGGVRRLVGDLNALLRAHAALHARDSEPASFEWIEAHDAQNSVCAWLRRDAADDLVVVVCNFTPVPREGFRLGVPAWHERPPADAAASPRTGARPGPRAWREVLNTDSRFYGGSDLGNGTHALRVQEVPAHGRAQSITLTLPPLATLFLTPEPAP